MFIPKETSNSEASYGLYVENSRAGIMKRSGMDVGVTSPFQSMPIYKVEKSESQDSKLGFYLEFKINDDTHASQIYPWRLHKF